MAVIETARVRLRTWQSADREPFAQLNGDPRVMEFLAGVLSRAQSDAAIDGIESHFAQHGFGPFALELRDSGAFIGAAGPMVIPFHHHFTSHIELLWRLAFDHWGKGLATEAVGAILTYCGETLQLREIVAFTAPANARSRRVMENSGMIHDPAGDFDHPGLPEGHPLRRHVLYSYTY